MQSCLKRAAAIALSATMLGACGASRSYRRGVAATRAGDWDSAVQHYTHAVQEYPDRPEYRIALERAQQTASNIHFDAGRTFDEGGDLENAIAEYRRAVEINPGHRPAAARRVALERMVRERAEAHRPTSPLDEMRAVARRETEGPLLNPTSSTPLKLTFVDASAIDVLTLLGHQSGINIVFEPTYRDQARNKPVTLLLDGVSFEEGLRMVMTVTGSWYKIINPHTILVLADTPQMRNQYEEQVVRTFYISHAEPTELYQLVQQMSRTLMGAGAAPVQMMASKGANTIVARGSAAAITVVEKIIQANDRPRAEVVIDLEILEVSRSRTKQLGLNLNDYALTTIFSPEARPSGDGKAAAPFNLNTISQGISTADFYMTVPSAVFRFLASDGSSRQLAKPQLRGAEGETLTLNLGRDVPVPQAVFGGVGSGGVNNVPIQSFTYRTVGVRMQIKPRVTFDHEILLQIEVESSTINESVKVGGQELPTFGTRNVKGHLRLREGESHLLAGLLQERDHGDAKGFPGTVNTPLLKDLLGYKDTRRQQSDIVMLITPRIVRTHELTQEHLDPIYIGSSSEIGLTAPTPVIAAPPP